jgi:hypothetical protein
LLVIVYVYDLSSDGFFFFNLGSTCVDEFIHFMPFIILIFFNLAALAFYQWCICDDFETFMNQFCCDQCFVGFLKGFIKDFFLSTYARSSTFLWHHTLNQHIHIDTMYPYGTTHFNTMIFIPLCENCKLCIYWYEFSYFCFNTHTTMVYKFWKKNQILVPDGYVKSPILVQHWFWLVFNSSRGPTISRV